MLKIEEFEMIRTLTILSMRDARREFATKRSDLALISIVGADESPPEWISNAAESFSMRFDDVEDSLSDAGIPDENSTRGLGEFVENLKSENLAVHCLAGISRSAGVAAALNERFGLGMRIWSDGRYDPNPLAYEATKRELEAAAKGKRKKGGG